MPLWLSASLGALLRYFLFGIGTFMVSKGYWDQGVADTFVDGALAQILSWLLMVGPIVWMFIVKNIDKLNFVKAASTSRFVTESEVKTMPTPSAETIAKVTEPTSSPRLPIVLLMLASSLTMACATTQTHYQVARYGADATRLGLQAQQLVIEADKSGLQPNKDLTAKAMVAFRDLGGALQKLADGLRLYDSLTNPSEKTGQAQKIEDLLREARRLTRVVVLFMGQSEVGEKVITTFDALDRLFDEILKGLAGNPTLKAA